MCGPGIFSFKVLESPGKVLEFCSVISVATLEAELRDGDGIQLLLKMLPDSSVSSLIRAG